jgi:DNA-binding NtrC family response regulator
MSISSKTTKPRLLALDGDDTVLRVVAELGCAYYTVHATRSARTLLAWLNTYEDVAVVVTEHVLAAAAGVALLETARTMRPAARRVLITTYHDLASIVHGLHSGAIQKLVQKPFGRQELLAAILPEGLTLAGGEQMRRASA